ncbi:MAG: class I SAM-dependent methyltransferase [Anaerolineales bacterium]|nr:class I SAM-dependent methyltransferase [Anaerolineales bacterium]
MTSTHSPDPKNSEPQRDLEKAAQCGEPSYVWRAGQQRRLKLILEAAGERVQGEVLENGCGVGMYVEHLAPYAGKITGLEYEPERTRQAKELVSSLANARIIRAAGENLPFPTGTFSLILSHEVLEHVHDDQRAANEMVRALKPGGRIVLFAPNRGYPFETHGIYWRGHYHFGNIPLVNYLPRQWRDRLAPHVRIYTRHDLEKLFLHLPVRIVEQRVIYGAYDNIIARFPAIGKALRAILQGLESSPLRGLGLSHFWVIEKT